MRICFFSLGLSLAWGLFLSPATPATTLHVQAANADSASPRSVVLADTLFDGTPYLAIEALDSLLEAPGQWVPDRQKWVAKDKQGKSWVFTLDNAFCSIADRVFNLTYPMRRGQQKLYLPLHPLLRLLKSEADLAVSVSQISLPPKPSIKGESESANANIDKHLEKTKGEAWHTLLGPVSCESRSNGTLVNLKVLGNSNPETFWVPPNFIARFPGAKVAQGTPSRIDGKGLVQSILLTTDSNQVQLTLQLRGNIDTVESETDSELPGLRFLVRKAGAKKKTDKPATPKTAHGGKGTIIIDPGHGGHDQGAAVDGVHEAQITLAVGLQLKSELQKLGYKAVLTREDDRYLTLQDRPKFASDHGGDLFLSLHCNSIDGTKKRKQQVSGFTAYILRAGASEEDNALARRENQAIQEEKGKAGKSEISPVDWILLEHQLNLYSKESEIVAEKIIGAFEGFDIPKYSTGAGQAGFFVLVGAYMPAVLFEMGFLTHDRDRTFMASKKGQKRIARQLSEAIDRFMSYRQGD